MPAYDSALHWFRRDLRDDDNAGLFHALKSARRVHCVFVFDREILDRLVARADRRVQFIWESVRELQGSLRAKGGDLIVLHDTARTAIPGLAKRLGVDAVFARNEACSARTLSQMNSTRRSARAARRSRISRSNANAQCTRRADLRA